jgi:ribosomal protein S18 acetylase RimI-like enzyme
MFDMLSQRPIHLDEDRQLVLDLACQASYESVPDWLRSENYRAYRDFWLNSSLAEDLIRDLRSSLDDDRTIAEVWLEENKPAGILWVTFTDSPYEVVIARLRDLVVAPDHQRRGIGSLMLKAAEDVAHERGARVLRAETGVENNASQALYGRHGFNVVSLVYEKALEAAASFP